MAYGSSTWNSSISKKNYPYQGADILGYLHGSNSAEGLASILSDYNNRYGSQYLSNALEDINSRNVNAAERQWEMQQISQAQSMAYDAVEAQKNRDWQLWMSDTAHQREILDLQRAGLNPILSVNNGAAVGSGAVASSTPTQGSKAEVDASLALGLIDLIKDANNNAYDLAQTKMSTLASMFNAETVADASRFSALLSSAASRYGSELTSAAMRYSSENALEGTKFAAMRSYLASIFGTNTQKEMQQEQFAQNILQPNNMFGAASSIGILVGKLLGSAFFPETKLSIKDLLGALRNLAF